MRKMHTRWQEGRRVGVCERRMGSWFSSPTNTQATNTQAEVPEEGQERRGRQVIDEPMDYIHECQPLPMPIHVHQDVCTDAHHQECHTGDHLAPCHNSHHDWCHNDHHPACADASHYTTHLYH